VTEELKNYVSVIDSLHQQAKALGPEVAESPEVSQRLASIDNRYKELLELAKLRKQRLLDALSLYKLLSESDGVEQWISEKDRMLQTMIPARDIEDVEIMKHRYEGFEKEMNANASRVAVVNQLARQLLHVEHPNSEQITARQNQLNQKWAELREKAEAKKEELNSAHGGCPAWKETWLLSKQNSLPYKKKRTLSRVNTPKKLLLSENASLRFRSFGSGSPRCSKNAIPNWKKLETCTDSCAISTTSKRGDQDTTDIASEDTPSSLSEAEKLLSQHQAIREEIDNYTEDYAKMMEYGEKITAEPSTQDDPQYMFLRERLKALKDGWDEIHQMWENRQQLLSQSLSLQLLDRDARQAERHEAFLATMEANDDKINGVVEFSRRLCDENHFAADKIHKRADNIDERRLANREKAQALLERLRDQLELHQFLRDCDELGEWIQEKHITAQDETYRSAKTVHSKWTRHQAFEAEIAANKERLHNLQKAGEELAKEKPEYASYIQPKIEELADQFDVLEQTTKEKGERLFDANREVLIHQTCDDIDSWMNELEKQIESDDTGSDLASVNILMQKQQMIETQMAVKARQHLETATPEKDMQHIKTKKSKVEERFQKLKEPLLERQKLLEKKKEALQFRRDIEDELSWISEKMPLATSTEYGNSLFQVHMLEKKNQSLQTEVDNHEPRINTVCNNGQKLIDEGHQDAAEFSRLISELHKAWQELKDAIEKRREHLLRNERAQQYLFDANEAESKDETSARNLMKKHESLEAAVEAYADTIRQLGETVRALAAEGHPLAEQVAIKQSQLDKLYAGLKDLAQERRAKLDEALQLFLLNRDVGDLEQWIADREVVASSQELGQDYDHVTLLWERFKEFARDTETIGGERVAAVNDVADQLIAAGHSDSATVAEWKDGLNEAWQDLLELIETRMQMLAASRELHKFFHDCKDVLSRIVEKQVGDQQVL
ncbi:unnamed protein product, partial [Acanthoscelides obtectus]